MQRRICHKEQKGKKGASGYALRTLLAELKSGQFICSKSGHFYLLTTAQKYCLSTTDTNCILITHLERYFT